MIDTVGVDGIVKIAEQIGTVACEEINSSDLTLLKNLVGIESIAEQCGVTVEDFAVAQFSAGGAGRKLSS